MRNELQAAVRYFEMRCEGKTDFEALAMCDRREMERTALSALRDALQRQPDPDTGLVPCDYCTDTFDARKQFAEVVNENVGKRVKGCWYCNDDVMQVVDSPNKPPINATYCGLCGRKMEGRQ